MGLWSLVGGAAKGYGEEGKYLDQQAEKARAAALDERRNIQEAGFRDRSLAAEQTFREHQLGMDKNRLEFEKLRSTRDEARADREYQLRLKQMDQEHADRQASMRLSSSNAAKKFSPKVNSWNDVIDYYAKIYAPQGIYGKELTDLAKQYQPEMYDEYVKNNPSRDPARYGDLFVESNFNGKPEEDIKTWNDWKSKNPRLAPLISPQVDSYFGNTRSTAARHRGRGSTTVMVPGGPFGSLPVMTPNMTEYEPSGIARRNPKQIVDQATTPNVPWGGEPQYP